VTGTKGYAVLKDSKLQSFKCNTDGCFVGTDVPAQLTEQQRVTLNTIQKRQLSALPGRNPSSSSMFHTGVQIAAFALADSLVSRDSTPWVAGGGATLSSALPTQLFFEAASKSIRKRGSWVKVPQHPTK